METAHLKRIVFDEGHHLFDAADSAFAACLSGAEAAEMRRWIRGPEGRGRRGRGLEARLSDVLAERETAREALDMAVRAASVLPGEGFGPSAAGHVRICVTTDEERLREACRRIARLAGELVAETGERGIPSHATPHTIQ